MAKVKELPILDRPREKALYYGIESLADHELLALLIGSGSTDNSAIDIAYFMLRDSKGLLNLVEKPLLDLMNYKGIAKARALKLVASFELAKRYQKKRYDEKEVINDSEAIYLRMKKMFSNSVVDNQEIMYLVILNKKKEIVHETNLYKGIESSVNASTTQIIQQVIMHSGNYFYIVHNHPSDEPEPSEEDIFFTVNLVKECIRFKITMLDHLIITHHGYYSFHKQLVLSDSEETV